jgi:hypothetical protein
MRAALEAAEGAEGVPWGRAVTALAAIAARKIFAKEGIIVVFWDCMRTD